MPYPANKDISIYQGDDQSWAFYLRTRVSTDPDVYEDFDLTGYALDAHIRVDVADYDPSVEAQMVFQIDDPATGRFIMHLTSEASTSLAKGRYRWDLQMTRTVDHYVTTLLYGVAVVDAEVTRPA